MKRNESIDMRRAFMGGNPLHQLIAMLVSVFFLLQFARLVVYLASGSSPDYMMGFQSAMLWMGTPLSFPDFFIKSYTLLTGIFVHLQILPLIFNLLSLYIFGRIFIEFLGRKRLLPLFLYAGIFATFATVLIWQIPYLQINHSHTMITGSSASILGIMAATTVLYPNLPLNLVFLGPVRLKYIALFYVSIHALLHTPDMQWAGYATHILGILFGLSYAILFKKGFDLTSGWVRINDQVFGKKVRVRAKMKVYQNKRPLSDDQYNSIKREREATLDEILDKINASGIQSLTQVEKELLNRYSREN
ncbi:MAG: rhomboid family intramembrane serine protease [Candidatus Competibacteraceae bacterium]|nr:rhomboid family intramembrane serine protease [Candidatus Competibacteraceae bacterium]